MPSNFSKGVVRSAYNLARFDFISVRLAVLCAQGGSLTAAARDCRLVVPAASRRLRELEEAVGEPLFERHSRGLRPTQAGKTFVKHGVVLLQGLDNLREELNDLRNGVVRHIRLTASTAAINQFLPPLLARYANAQPAIQIDLEEEVSDRVVASLREASADIGAYVSGPDDTGLETQHFRNDQLVLILPTGHRLAGRSAISFVDTLDEAWISLNTGAALLHQQRQAAFAAGKPFKLRMQVRSFDALGHMVASGLGIAVLPKAVALPMLKVMRLTSRPLNDAWSHRELKIAIRSDADAAVRAVRDFLCKQNAKADLAKLS